MKCMTIKLHEYIKQKQKKVNIHQNSGLIKGPTKIWKMQIDNRSMTNKDYSTRTQVKQG